MSFHKPDAARAYPLAQAIAYCPSAALEGGAYLSRAERKKADLACSTCQRRFRLDGWLDGASEDGITQVCRIKPILRDFMRR